MYTIGIDIGTTNCKICLFQIPTLELVSQYSFTTPKTVNSDVHSNFDIHMIWESVVHGLKTVIKSLNKGVNEEIKVSAIAVASVGEAGVLLDANNDIIDPVLTWFDPRSEKQLDDIISAIDMEHIYEITGIPAHSNYSINKIKWLQENIKDAKNGKKWLCLAEYIAFKLSGKKRSEYSLASRTMALNINQMKWDEKILTAAGLAKSLFSPLVYAGEAIGNITTEIARLTGLSSSTQVAIGGHDHMCGSVAVGINNEDQILNSTGTTEGLLMVTKSIKNSREFLRARVSNGIHVLPEFYSLYASLPSAGYAIEWFRNLFKLDMPRFLTMVDDLNNEQKSIINSAIINKTIDGIFIPHLRGSGPPERNTKSKALLYGMDESSHPKDVLRFVFQGLCFELKNLLDVYETLTGQSYPTVNVIGAACKNPYWLQLKANILNRTIIACNIDEAVSKGAAMLAAKAVGVDISTISVTTPKQNKCYRPEHDAVLHYQHVFQRLYKPLYESKIYSEHLYHGVLTNESERLLQ